MRRTRTTIEKRETFVIRGYGKRPGVLCPECSEIVGLVTLDEAVRISGISSRAVHRAIEGGEIHFVETAEGIAFICPATLLALVSEEASKMLFGQRRLAHSSLITEEEP
jgi:hypothetical protein